MEDAALSKPTHQPVELRIGTPERARAEDALAEHLAAKRIDPAEFERRVAACRAAGTRSELMALFADLPAPHPSFAEPSDGTAPGTEATKPTSSDSKLWNNVVFYGLLLFYSWLTLNAVAIWGWWALLVMPVALAVVSLIGAWIVVLVRTRRRGGR
ncbi:DUF1707 domain-containing protein [Plantactinospora sp. GCM10030261]|uniref:DUF1707 SHOCT-like domain-containing protein n=1 Tax=Plantactinospora sp. GCM10030261 TaxID=3273420 RepID=UPI003621725E